MKSVRLAAVVTGLLLASSAFAGDPCAKAVKTEKSAFGEKRVVKASGDLELTQQGESLTLKVHVGKIGLHTGAIPTGSLVELALDGGAPLGLTSTADAIAASGAVPYVGMVTGWDVMLAVDAEGLKSLAERPAAAYRVMMGGAEFHSGNIDKGAAKRLMDGAACLVK